MRKPLITKKYLVQQADLLWKMAVAKIWGTDCEVCGQPATPPHHYIERSRSADLKHIVENGVPLCQNCHNQIHFSHKIDKIREIAEAIRQNRGKEWCEWLDEVKNIHSGSFQTVGYYKKVIEYLKSLIQS